MNIIKITYSASQGMPQINPEAFDAVIKTSVVSEGDKLALVVDSSVTYEFETPVTKIGANAFFDFCIHKITLPDSVESIHPEAFYDISEIESKLVVDDMLIQDNVLIKYLGDGYEEVVMPEGIVEIAPRACKILPAKKLALPAKLKVIGNEAFLDCFNLTSIKFPRGLEKIGDKAFARTLLGTVTIPDTVKSIGTKTFAGCKKLKKIKLGKGLETIGEGAFAQCSLVAKTEGKFTEDNTIVVGDTLVAVFGEREEFTVPEAVTRIGNWAFSSSSDRKFDKRPLGPKEITLHGGVKRIGDYAFSGTRLMKLYIPESVEAIGANPILATPCASVEGKFTFENRAIICGDRFCAHVKRADCYAIPEGIAELGDDAFNGVSLPDVTVTLPKSVKRIGKRCFAAIPHVLSFIQSIVLNEGLEIIDDMAFKERVGLTSLVFPSTLQQLGDKVITHTTYEELTSITFLGLPPSNLLNSLSHKFVLQKRFKGVVKVPAESLEAYKALLPVLLQPTSAYPDGRILSL